MIKEFRISALSVSIIMFALGILLLLKPEMSVLIICYIVAAGLLILAITRLINFAKLKKNSSAGASANMVFAILLVIFAAIIAFRPATLAGVIPVILGVFIVVNGIVFIATGLMYRDYLPNRGIVTILFGVVLFILGCYSIRHSFSVQVMLMRFLGVALAISGGSNLVNHFMLERADRKKQNATTVSFEVHKEKESE